MNPAQPNVPDAGEICLLALEQAYANSLAKQDNTQKQLDKLLNGFQQLEKFILVEKIPPISPKIHPSDIIPGFAHFLPDIHTSMPRFLSGGTSQDYLGFIIYEVQMSS